MKSTGLCLNGYGTHIAFFNAPHWQRVKSERIRQGMDRKEIELSPGVKMVALFDAQHWQRVKSERIRQGLN